MPRGALVISGVDMKDNTIDVRLIIRTDRTQYKSSCSEIRIKESDTGIMVPGCLLEACVDAGNGTYILFTTDDTLFEEALYISHVDLHKKSTLDGMTMFVPYATGIFKMLAVQKDSILFQFISEIPWELSITRKPTFFTGRLYKKIKRRIKMRSTLKIRKRLPSPLK